MPRGGKRPGAGRPASEKKKSYTFYLSEKVAKAVKDLIEKMRQEELDVNKNK